MLQKKAKTEIKLESNTSHAERHREVDPENPPGRGAFELQVRVTVQLAPQTSWKVHERFFQPHVVGAVVSFDVCGKVSGWVHLGPNDEGWRRLRTIGPRSTRHRRSSHTSREPRSRCDSISFGRRSLAGTDVEECIRDVRDVIAVRTIHGHTVALAEDRSTWGWKRIPAGEA